MTTKIIYESNQSEVIRGTIEKPAISVLFSSEFYRGFALDLGICAYLITSSPDRKGHVTANLKVLDSETPIYRNGDDGLFTQGIKEIQFIRNSSKEKE